MTKNNFTKRIFIQSENNFYYLGKLKWNGEKGDIYYSPSEKIIYNTNHKVSDKNIQKFTFHSSGQKHITTIKNDLIEYAIPIKEIKFHYLFDEIIRDFTKLPNNKTVKTNDIILKIKLNTPLKFIFVIMKLSNKPEGKIRKLNAKEKSDLIDGILIKFSNHKIFQDLVFQIIVGKFSGNIKKLSSNNRIFTPLDRSYKNEKNNQTKFLSKPVSGWKETEIGLIPEDWEFFQIKDIGKVITGKTPSSTNPEYFGNDLPFITPTDFGNYNKTADISVRYLSKEGERKLKGLLIPAQSPIVTCIGSDMGKVAITKEECITNQQINSVIINKDMSDSHYIYYCLKNKYLLLRSMSTGGSTMPIINKTDFENIEILIPPISEQQKIAGILGAN